MVPWSLKSPHKRQAGRSLGRGVREEGREDAKRLIQTRKKEAEAMEGKWPLADGKAKDTSSPRAS